MMKKIKTIMHFLFAAAGQSDGYTSERINLERSIQIETKVKTGEYI